MSMPIMYSRMEKTFHALLDQAGASFILYTFSLHIVFRYIFSILALAILRLLHVAIRSNSLVLAFLTIKALIFRLLVFN